MAPYGSNSPTTDMSSTQVPGLTLDWGAGGNNNSERVWTPNTPSSNDPESCVAELQQLLRGHFQRRLNGSQPKPFQGTHLPPTNSEQTTATPETPVNLTKWTLTPTTTTTAATRLAQARIASPLGFAGITAESSPQVPRIHNLVAPRRPPTWTSAPLIPVASLASPRLQNAPFEDSGPLRSPWPVPAAIGSGPSRNPGIFGSVNQAGYPNIASALREPQHDSQPAGQTSVIGGFHPQQTQTAMSTPFPAAAGTPENPWIAHQTPEMANNQTSFFGQRFPGFIPTQAALQRGVSPGSRINGLGPLSPPPSYYFPMSCRTEAERKRTRTHKEAMELMLKGFSPNYRGDPDLARNQSADIPPDQNCSLFMVGLAPNLTTHELLAGIRDCGRVYATHINPPAPEKGHAFSAAKLVFFERKSAGKNFSIPSKSLAIPHPFPQTPTKQALTLSSQQSVSTTASPPPATSRPTTRTCARV
jgi:hypothetical protein